jgi:phage major head subunit gpT-like protein
MLTPNEVQRLLKSGLNTAFMKSYDSVQTYYQNFVTQVPSTKSSEEYGWLGDSPELREWNGERLPKALREFGFVLKNKKYESSIRVDQDAIDDDQYGQIVFRVSGMGDGAKRSYDKQFVAVVEAGRTTNCYDGQFFFDTDHSEGSSGTQSNLFTSSALSATTAKTIITAMEQYKTDEGRFSGVRVTDIMVPSTLEWTAKEIFDPTAVAVSTDPAKAVLRGRVKVNVNPYLNGSAGANAPYYFMDLSGYIKPFIFQIRKPIKFDQVTTDNPDTQAFMTDANLYGVKARHAFGYGDWRLCAMGTGGV